MSEELQRVPLFDQEEFGLSLAERQVTQFDSTFGESLKASYDLSNMDTSTESLINLSQHQLLKSKEEDRLTPEQLNEQFPDMPEPFNEPMNKSQAEYIYNRNSERRRLESVIGSGPQGVFYGTARFAAGMVPHALDPVDFVASLGVGKVLTMAAKGAKWGAILAKTATRGERLAVDVVEGVAGNVAGEVGVYFSNKADHQDYGAQDALMNITAGAVGFAGLKYAGGKVIDHLRTRPELHERAVKTSIAQMAAGERVDADLHIKEVASELGGHGGKIDYQYAKKGAPELSNSVLYVGSKQASYDLDNIQTASLSREVGEGVYITDNPNVANNMAASKASSEMGHVVEVRTSDLNTLDLDRPLDPGPTKNIVEMVLGEKIPEGKTLGDFIDDIKRTDGAEEKLKKLNETLSEGGFDGYHWEGNKVLGKPHDPNNQLMLFNKDKLEFVSNKKADQGNVSRVPQEDIEKAKAQKLSGEKSDSYDPEARNKVNESLQEAAPSVDAKSTMSELESRVSDLEELKKQGLLSEEEILQIDDMRQDMARVETVDQMIKAGTLCFTRGG